MAPEKTASDTPLRRLVVKATDVSEEVLADLLQPYLRFTEEGEVLFEHEFHSLTAADRLLVTLIGTLAASKLGFAEGAKLTPTEIVALTGLPEGTAKPTLRRLAKDRLVRAEKGKYDVPPYALSSVVKRIGSLRASAEQPSGTPQGAVGKRRRQ